MAGGARIRRDWPCLELVDSVHGVVFFSSHNHPNTVHQFEARPYVAALVSSVLNLLYLLTIARDRR